MSPFFNKPIGPPTDASGPMCPIQKPLVAPENLPSVISATFSVTRDLDAIFPAAIARQRPQWNNVPLLDVQQMHVEGSLERCIRFLIYVNMPETHPQKIVHIYLREAKNLRPDWVSAQ